MQTRYDTISLFGKEKLQELFDINNNFADILRALGLEPRQASSGYAILRRCVKKMNLSVIKFEQNVLEAKMVFQSTVLSVGSTFNPGNLKKYLWKEGLLKEECSECGLGPVWNNKPIMLQLDHVNGVNDDNRLENLRILCPNCHTQTKTYAGRRFKKEYCCKNCLKKIKKNTSGFCFVCFNVINNKIRKTDFFKIKDGYCPR